MNYDMFRRLALAGIFVLATNLSVGGIDQRPIDIDPGGGGNVVITSNNGQYTGPGKTDKLRYDVAKTKYAICLNDGSTIQELAELTYVTKKDIDGVPTYDIIRFEQTADPGITAIIKVYVNDNRIGDSRLERCKYKEENRSCKDAGLPGELDGEVVSMSWRIKGHVDWHADEYPVELKQDEKLGSCH